MYMLNDHNNNNDNDHDHVPKIEKDNGNNTFI